jgi:hypothetical protein
VFAFQITPAGQLNFKISQGRNRRRSQLEMAAISLWLNEKKSLFETGFQKVLVEGKF